MGVDRVGLSGPTDEGGHGPPTGETRDGAGFGDHDYPYVFGNASANLTTRQQAKLMIMRGFFKDFRAGEKGGAADGDVPVIERPEGKP